MKTNTLSDAPKDKNGIPILDNIHVPMSKLFNLRIQVFHKTNGVCFYCGKRLQLKNSNSRKDYMTIDHKIPKCDGGSNDIDNMVPACKACNSAKADKNFNYFMEIKDMEKFILTEGMVVKLAGLPFKLVKDTEVYGTQSTFKTAMEEYNQRLNVDGSKDSAS